MTTPAKLATSICVAAAMFVAGYMANRQPAPAVPSGSSRQVLYYTCPMHPQYKSDHPGDAPCCGMRMVPVYAGDTGLAAAAAADPPGVVQLSAGRQQLIGVRTGEVRRAPASHLLRVPGRITVDDDRLYRIIAASDGWVRSLGPNPAGTFVKKDQILGTFYTQNFQTAQQNLLFNLTSADVRTSGAAFAARGAPLALNLQVAIDTLRGLGVSDRQIAELQKTRQFAPEIYMYCPISGFVIARNVSPEQRFDKGLLMYRIADIRHVWVMTDIFEKDREFVRPGAMAIVHYRGREYPARMSDVLPQFDPDTRTLKTRFELDNPGYVLRPDMFVDVEVHVKMPEAVTIPADAIIYSGREQTVFVERGPGRFEPRAVQTGWRLGDRVEITSGLEPGDRIVVSGNFLIDSESRMRLAAVSPSAAPESKPPLADARASVPAAAKHRTATASERGAAAEVDPVCGMEVDPKAADAIKSVHAGKTFYFCSKHCQEAFEAKPEKYRPKGAMSARDSTRQRGPA